MSLADRLPHITSDRKLCTTCSWLAGLPDRDRAAFDQLIKRDDISTTQLLGICQEEGLACQESAFRRHLQHHRTESP